MKCGTPYVPAQLCCDLDAQAQLRQESQAGYRLSARIRVNAESSAKINPVTSNVTAQPEEIPSAPADPCTTKAYLQSCSQC